jgi:hypothetical protein
MAGPEEIAKAKITIEGDASGAKKATEDVIGDLEGVGDASDNASQRVSGGFAKAGEAIESSTSGVRKFVGALSSVAGVATGLVGIFGLVSGAVLGFKAVLDKLGGDGKKDAPLPKTTDLMQKLADSARGVDRAMAESGGFVNLQNRLKDARKELEDAQRVLTFEGRVAGEDTVQRVADAQAEVNQLIQQSNDLLKTYGESQERAAQQAIDAAKMQEAEITKQADAIRQLQELIAEQTISLLPDDQQILAQATRQRQIIEDAFRNLGVAIPDDLLQTALENVDRITQKQLDAERERQRIADEAQAQREAEADRRSQDRVQREIETLREGLNSITGDFTTVFNELASGLRDVADSTARLK